VRTLGALRRSLLCVALASLALHGAAAAQDPAWRVTGGDLVVVCPLTVGGSFEARTRSVTGELRVEPSQPARVAGEMTVDLRTLDSGIGLRNTHMRDNYLEVGRGDGFDRAVLSDIVLDTDAATASGEVGFTASLLVHGVRKPVAGRARITRSGGDVRVEATFPLTLADFEIAEPRYLGVGVKDQVQVKVKFGSSR